MDFTDTDCIFNIHYSLAMYSLFALVDRVSYPKFRDAIAFNKYSGWTLHCIFSTFIKIYDFIKYHKILKIATQFSTNYFCWMSQNGIKSCWVYILHIKTKKYIKRKCSDSSYKDENIYRKITINLCCMHHIDIICE